MKLEFFYFFAAESDQVLYFCLLFKEMKTITKFEWIKCSKATFIKIVCNIKIFLKNLFLNALEIVSHDNYPYLTIFCS